MPALDPIGTCTGGDLYDLTGYGTWTYTEPSWMAGTFYRLQMRATNFNSWTAGVYTSGLQENVDGDDPQPFATSDQGITYRSITRRVTVEVPQFTRVTLGFSARADFSTYPGYSPTSTQAGRVEWRFRNDTWGFDSGWINAGSLSPGSMPYSDSFSPFYDYPDSFGSEYIDIRFTVPTGQANADGFPTTGFPDEPWRMWQWSIYNASLRACAPSAPWVPEEPAPGRLRRGLGMYR